MTRHFRIGSMSNRPADKVLTAEAVGRRASGVGCRRRAVGRRVRERA